MKIKHWYYLNRILQCHNEFILDFQTDEGTYITIADFGENRWYDAKFNETKPSVFHFYEFFRWWVDQENVHLPEVEVVY